MVNVEVDVLRSSARSECQTIRHTIQDGHGDEPLAALPLSWVTGLQQLDCESA
jgi:hypothetical protein